MNVVSFGGGTNSTAMIIGMYLHKSLLSGLGNVGGMAECECHPLAAVAERPEVRE